MSISPKFCSNCGAQVAPGARFCRACGHPVSDQPVATPQAASAPPRAVAPAAPPPSALPGAAPVSRRKTSPVLLVIGGLLTVCVCVVCGLGGITMIGSVGGATPTLQADSTPDPQVTQSLENSVTHIESSFRAGDVATVVRLTHPALRDSYQPVFEAHRADLKRVADLLATRKLVSVNNGMAEYQVTENGKVFYVTFESWGDQWYLSSF